MSYSYVKCCEGSVVWDISKVPHEGMRTSESNIIPVCSLLRERGACESSFSASPVWMWGSCWKKAEGVENFRGPVGQDMGPALLYRPGAVLIPVS